MNVSTLAGLLLCDVINQSLNKKNSKNPQKTQPHNLHVLRANWKVTQQSFALLFEMCIRDTKSDARGLEQEGEIHQNDRMPSN